MQETAKYLIHADITASGVVERSDVVGAIFGQTEGLLGDDLDLRELQESGKLGRIDVEIDSENGSSFGEITIASGLDKVRTAILAASLESMERVGPCRATVEIRDIEDVRTAKRREVVERAKELLAAFDETSLTSDEIVEEVRQSIRVEEITEYERLPAGPRVADSDAIIVVEGRADVLQLLKYGIKNAIAVEGTNVPEAVAALTEDRTVTAFLDGDRGGDLILRELAQVGDVDYVAFAPNGQSVEDLSRDEAMGALREKVAYDRLAGDDESTLASADHSHRPAPPDVAGDPSGSEGRQSDSNDRRADDERTDPDEPSETVDATAGTPSDSVDVPPEPGTESDQDTEGGEVVAVTAESGGGNVTQSREAAGKTETTEERGAASEHVEPEPEPEPEPETLADHVAAIVDDDSGRARFLDDEFGTLAECAADDAFDELEAAETVPETVVLDGELTQRLLDVAAQRGVAQVVANSTSQFVKQPIGVRVRTAGEI